MRELLFDNSLRVRRSVFNVAVFYMILVGFLYSLLLGRYVQNTGVYLGLSVIQPIVVFGVPAAVVLFREKKFSASLPKVSFQAPAIRKRDFLYAVLIAVFGWLFYTYFSYMIEGFRAAITSSLSLNFSMRMKWWEYLIAIFSAGILAVSLREYFFRYLGRKAYGRTVWGYLLAVLLSAMVCYDFTIAFRLFLLGALSAAVYFGSGRMVFPFLVSFIFESLQVVLPSVAILPLSVYGVTSVEMALVYGLFGGAISMVLAVGIFWILKLMRFKVVKKKFVFKKQDILTYVLCFVAFVGLLIWNKFI